VLGALLPSRWRKLREMRQRVVETATMLKMTELLARKPGQLSGGQRQRVAVGRAMVRQPLAFLMDEPLSNLDAALRVHMRAEIADLHRQLATTFIYVTHDQAEALTMSNRIAVMMDGELLQIDTPDKLYRDPTDLRVAQFIGSPKMNTLPADVDSAGRISTPGGYTLKGSTDNDAERAVIGLRPEHLNIDLQAPNGHNMPVVVRYKENLGADVFVHADVDGSEHRLVIRTQPEIASRLNVDDRAEVWQGRNEVVVFGGDNRRLPFTPAET
jgi:multiple sugar transport system ATP-binding protein